MKTLIGILFIVSMCGATLFAQESAEAEEKIIVEKKGVFTTIKDGFAESTRNISEINKENMEAIKAESKENFEEATTPSPALVRFREAKGFWNKIKAIAESVVEGAKESSEKEKARRAEIQSHDSYKKVLEQQRSNTHAIMAH